MVGFLEQDLGNQGVGLFSRFCLFVFGGDFGRLFQFCDCCIEIIRCDDGFCLIEQNLGNHALAGGYEVEALFAAERSLLECLAEAGECCVVVTVHEGFVSLLCELGGLRHVLCDGDTCHAKRHQKCCKNLFHRMFFLNCFGCFNLQN